MRLLLLSPHHPPSSSSHNIVKLWVKGNTWQLRTGQENIKTIKIYCNSKSGPFWLILLLLTRRVLNFSAHNLYTELVFWFKLGLKAGRGVHRIKRNTKRRWRKQEHSHNLFIESGADIRSEQFTIGSNLTLTILQTLWLLNVCFSLIYLLLR